MDKDIYFGIDFGTTNSAMSWYDPEKGEAKIILNAEGEDKTPSLVYYGEDGILVGKPVEDLIEDSEDFDEEERLDITLRTQKGIKRELISPPVRPIPGGKQVRPAEVVAEILKKLKRDAEEGHFNKEIQQAVITCPAMYDNKQRKVIREAAALAGFEEVELVEEPVAAAVAFAHRGQDVGKGVLVYDLGGGTFDVAVVTREEGSEDGSFRVAMEADGDRHCGGEDFDQAIYDYCDGIARQSIGRSVNEADGSINRYLQNECRKQKERLSFREKATVREFLDGARLKAEIDRQTFEGLIAARVEETVSKTAAMLERAKRRGHKVDTVVLIGGSTQVPLVARRLGEDLTVEPRRFAEKDYAVALGAAYHAYELHEQRERKERERKEAERRALEQRHRQQQEEQERKERERREKERQEKERRALEQRRKQEEQERKERERREKDEPATYTLARTITLPQTKSRWKAFWSGTNAANSLAFSPNGQLLAAGCANNTIKLWDANTSQLRRQWSGHSNRVKSVCFSPHGHLLASVGDDSTVKLWDANTGELLRTLAGHRAEVESVAFSPDGGIIASGSREQTVKLWDSQTGKTLHTLSKHVGHVQSVAFSPDGQLVASAAAVDGKVILWDAYTGQDLRTITTGGSSTLWETVVTFSPDGRLLASGGASGSVTLWNPRTGERRQTLTVTGHSNYIKSIVFSPNGRTLVSGSFDKTVKLWNPRTGELRQTLTGHTAPVSSVAFSPDGRLLASSSGDEMVRIWERN